MVAPLIWYLMSADSAPPVVLTALAIVGGLVFGIPALLFLGCAFDRSVQLRIEDNELLLKPHSSKPINLRSIKHFRIDGRMLKLLLYKPSKYPIEGRWRRFLFRINGSGARSYFGDAWIMTQLYDCNLGQVFDAVNAHIELTEFEKETIEIRKRSAAAAGAAEG